MGYALRFVQAGVKPDAAKPLKGFKGASVQEVVENRAVYTVKLAGVVYVPHCFQKKSKSGVAMPRHAMDLIRQRLRVAEATHKDRIE